MCVCEYVYHVYLGKPGQRQMTVEQEEKRKDTQLSHLCWCANTSKMLS